MARFALVLGAASLIPHVRMFADETAAPASRPRIEVQYDARIDTAMAELATLLDLSEPQQDKVRELMTNRAHALQEDLNNANHALLIAVDALLNGPQKRQVTLENIARWGFDQWQQNVPSLSDHQAAKLKQLIDIRFRATRAALKRAQGAYAAGLDAVLTPEQQKNLVARQTSDPVVRIPMQ